MCLCLCLINYVLHDLQIIAFCFWLYFYTQSHQVSADSTSQKLFGASTTLISLHKSLLINYLFVEVC